MQLPRRQSRQRYGGKSPFRRSLARPRRPNARCTGRRIPAKANRIELIRFISHLPRSDELFVLLILSRVMTNGTNEFVTTREGLASRL